MLGGVVDGGGGARGYFYSNALNTFAAKTPNDGVVPN
jgi:hypothetical protein